MKIQICLLFVVLVCNASAGPLSERDPQPEVQCDLVQPFDPDYKYTYKYVAVTEHRDVVNEYGSDIRITCTAVITVPRRCSGKLRVNDCKIEEGKMAKDGSMTYVVLPSSASFDREMGVSEMAFYFNGGQITGIFSDKQERTNVTNFKRGMLSSLQAYNPQMPKECQIGDVYQLPQVSVYGQGIVEHTIIAKNGSYASTVEVLRDTSKIVLPMERRQWNFIRMRSNNMHPLLSAFKNYMTISNEDRWAKTKQSCVYKLERGRQVSSARCEEIFPQNPILPSIPSYMMTGEPIQTRIRQEIDLVNSGRMTSQDRSKWDVTRFDRDSVMFQQEWEETNMVYTSGFEPSSVCLSLARNPVNDRAPALISKLSRWMTISSQEEIEKTWAICEKGCSSEQIKDARILWAELLNSCITSDWCQLPRCTNATSSTSCGNALESFIRSPAGETPEIKTACLASLESIYAPSSKIVDATLRLCRREERPTPQCVRTLGAVTKNFLDTCGSECQNDKSVQNAKRFLLRQLKKNCQTSSSEIERVMVAAAECIGSWGPKGQFADDTLLTCAINPEAPPTVVVKALISYGNVTGEKLNPPALQKLIALFKSKDAKFETRITCFHALVRKNIPIADVEKILATVMDDSDDYALVNHCRQDLRIQLPLRGSVFCLLHPETAENCIKSIVQQSYDIGTDVAVLQKQPEEKKFEWTREVLLPYFAVSAPCTVTINSVYQDRIQAALPILSRFTVQCLVEKTNITVVEGGVEIGVIRSVLGKIFGHNQFYADMFAQVFGTPDEPKQQYPAIDKLISEGKYSLLEDLFRARPPFYLKVLGQDIGIDVLASYAKMKQITVGNIWKILDIIEDGFDHQKFAIGQPFLMQHATPTCIGAPMISTIDISYIFKNKLSLKANLQRMLFSPNEDAIISIAPELHATGVISRNILKQFSPSCGATMQFKLGHGSGLDCSVNTNTKGVNIACKPKPGKSNVFYLSGRRSLSGPAEELPTASVCVDYRQRDLYNLQVCHQSASESGFAYEVNIKNELDTEFQAAIEWESKQEPGGTAIAKEFKVECAANSRTAPTSKKILWSSILSMIPSRNEIRCKIDREFFKWQGATNFMLTRKPGTSIINGCFLSANASSINSLEMKYFNTFKIIPRGIPNAYSMEGFASNVPTMDSKTGYHIFGGMEETPEKTYISRKIEFTLERIENRLEYLSHSFIAKKVLTGVNDMPGYETNFRLNGTLLPGVYKSITMDMFTYDNDKNYDKMMSFKGYFDAQQTGNPHFNAHGVKGSWKQSTSPIYHSEMYSISNWLHMTLNADRDAADSTRVQMRTDIPENEILYKDVVSGDFWHRVYSVQHYDKPVSAFVECNYTDQILPNGDHGFQMTIGHRLWQPIEQSYVYEKSYAKYINHKECTYCHSFEVNHPKTKLTSISRYSPSNPNNFYEEKWIKLHYSLLDYVTLYPSLSYYLIKNLKSEYAEVGYKVSTKEDKSRVKSVNLSAALLQNTGKCAMQYSPRDQDLNWVIDCALDASSLPLKVEMKTTGMPTEQDKLAIAINGEINYAGIGCMINGSIKLKKTNDVVCKLQIGYGSQPKLESQLLLDFTTVQRNTKIAIDGFCRRTYKPRSESSTYKFTGSSAELDQSKRDLELKFLCSNSEKMCASLTVYRGAEWIAFKRLVSEENYDRASIKYDEKVGLYSVDARSVNEMLWGVRNVKLFIESTASTYGLGIETPICNMSYNINDNKGIEAYSNFKTSWHKHKMLMKANFESAKYNVVWDDVEAGGIRIASSINLNYAILNLAKAFNAKIKLGAAPRAIVCEIEIPDFSFDLELSRDSEKTTHFKYLCELQAEPDKILVKQLKLPIMGRDIDVSETTLQCERRDGVLYGVTASNIKISLSPACKELEPVVVQGNIALNPDKILVKLEDAQRIFVVNINFVPQDMRNMHMEYIFTIMNNKVDLYWDMKKENKNWMGTCKCELSSRCWKTKEVTPFLTFVTEYNIAETSATANFPEMTSHCRLNHTLRYAPIPYENKMTFNTIVDGMTTKMIYADMMSPTFGSEVNTTITGCHMRLELMPGISVCMPESMTMKVKYWATFMSGVEVYQFRKIDNDWNVNMDLDFLVPHQSDQICKQKINGIVSGWSCAEGAKFCWPEQLHLRNVDYIATSGANQFWLELIPFYWLFLPSQYPASDVRNSDIHYSYTSQESTIHKLISTIRQPSSETPIKVTITGTVDTHKIGCDIKMESTAATSECSIEASYNPETYGWEYKQSIDMPRLKTSSVLKASSPLSITMCEMRCKMPNGIMRDFSLDYSTGTTNKLSYNMDLVIGETTGNTKSMMKWNMANGEWECTQTMKCPWVDSDLKMSGVGWTVTKSDLKYNASVGIISEVDIHFGDGNGVVVCKIGSLRMDVTKAGKQLHCNIGCNRYPWMNQTLSMTYSGDEITQWNVMHETIYSVCTSKFATTTIRVNAQELDCKMKNSAAAAKIEYLKESTGHRCRMAFTAQDGTKISCLTTPMLTDSTQAHLQCRKVEGEKETQFTNLPVTMQDFPMMDNEIITDKVIFMARFVGFCYKTITCDEEQLFHELQKIIQCSDEAICRHIAQIVKKDYYAIVREIRRIAGAKAFYYTRPAIGEYALYTAMSHIPGSMTWLPDLESTSVANNIKSLMNGDEISLVHWSFQPFYEMKVGMKIIKDGNSLLLMETDSEKYPWLRGSWSIMNEIVEGQRIVNITSQFLMSRSVMLLNVEGTNVRLLAQEFCTPMCRKSAMMIYNPDKTSDGRTNITSMFTKEGRLQFICDSLTKSDDWINTEIACFTDKERTQRIGKLTFSSLSKISSYETLDVDKILREVFNIKSASRRNAINEYLEDYSTVVKNGIYDYIKPSGSYSTAFHAAQYAIASLMHEISPYEPAQELSKAVSRFWRSIWNLDPNLNRAYEDIGALLSGLNIDWELETMMQNVLTPIMDAIGYVLEGHITTRIQSKDGAIWLMTDVSSTRFDQLNLKSNIRIKSLGWNNVISNVTIMHKMLTMQLDCHLEGAGFYIEKMRFNVPGVENQYTEMRFITNPKSRNLIEHEIYINMNEKAVYACRGSQRAQHVPMWHYMCYVIESEYLPPNPPSASVIGSFDMNLGDMPGSPVGMLTRLMRIQIAVSRIAIECCNDATLCDEIPLKIFHIEDPKIRRSITEYLGKSCDAWKKIIAGEEIQNENEDALVSMTRKYKSQSYVSMISHAMNEVRGTQPYMREEYDFSTISSVLSVVYPICAPVIQYSVIVAEYIVPSGVFNVSRSVRSPSILGDSKMTMIMNSEKLPILNYESVVSMSSEGVVNTSLDIGCVWVWLESEISGLQIIPKRGKFGLDNGPDGTDVIFRPEISIGIDGSTAIYQPDPTTRMENSVLVSFRFNANKRYSCDLRYSGLLSATLQCYQSRVGGAVAGTVEATCELTPIKLYSATSEIISKTISMKIETTPVISAIIDDACEVTNPLFKKAVVSNVVRDINFLGQFCKEHMNTFLNACAELMNLTKSFAWNMTVNSYSWLAEVFSASGGIYLNNWYSIARRGAEAFVSWCDSVTITLYELAKLFYQSGYELNRIEYELPTYLRRIIEYEKFVPKYSHAYYNYMKMLAMNVFSAPNCAAGMIHAAAFEQLITFNNHLYTLPKTLSNCEYLLAGDVKDEKVAILLSKNDIVIRLPSRTFMIDSNMRVFDGGKRGRERSPAHLPLYNDVISCTREKESLTCRTPVAIVTVLSTNNVRTAFFIKIAEIHCPNTRGMMGIGSNTTQVPRMMMMNGKVATSMEQFIESYASHHSCHIGEIPPEPRVSHDHCDRMFENENWMNECPRRRRSFMMACQQSARSPEEVCQHVRKFNMLCRMEGRLVKMSPECEMCRGTKTVQTAINKVQVTVVMSLSMKNSKTSLQEIVESIHTMAKRSDLEHSISFMTFGGRNELFDAACQVNDNRLYTPASMPWNLPEAQLNGPVPTFNSLRSAMWFVYENTPRAAEGVQNIYLFVAPEYMDFAFISTSTIGKTIREDMTRAYLYIPNICRRIGVKTGSTMGIRSLFTSTPTNTCVRTPDQLAAAVLANPRSTAPKTVSCTCREFNPFTGETMNACVPAA